VKYAVHIRRKKGAISLEEWTTFATGASELTRAAEDEAGVPVFEWQGARFVWGEGEIEIDDLDDAWCKKLGEIADRLDAEAIGDDGERYLSNGRVDYGDGAQTLHRISDLASLPDIDLHRDDRAVKKRRIVAIGAALVLILIGAAILIAR
jgi:hypothetical protein